MLKANFLFYKCTIPLKLIISFRRGVAVMIDRFITVLEISRYAFMKFGNFPLTHH